MMPVGSQKVVFLGAPPQFLFRPREGRRRTRTPYAADLRRLKRGQTGLKSFMRSLARNGEPTAKQWFENKRRTG